MKLNEAIVCIGKPVIYTHPATLETEPGIIRSVDRGGRQKCIDLGYSSMPVVLVESGQDVAHWSGFRMDEIKALDCLEGAPQ